MTDAGTQATPLWQTMARVLGVKPVERSARLGATSVEKVGRELAKLPAGWHGMRIEHPQADIDRLVIGSRGVFTVSTKHHPDATVCVYEQGLWVNGHSTVYLHDARRQAERAAQLLTHACAMPVEVHATIVFADPAKLTPKGTPADVHITTLRTLRTLLMQLPQRLTQSQVEYIHAAARSTATWQLV